jgi:hypothetical protein
MHRTVDEWKRYAEERKGRPGALPAVTEVLEDLLALGDIADKHMRLPISSRQWLGVLIDEFDIGPATTVIEVKAIGPGGKRALAQKALSESMAEIDAAIAPYLVKADNDG